MTVSIVRPEDAINAALGRIGYRLRVSSLVDGTRASNLALQMYGQTRDAALRQGDWGFAQKTVAGVVSGTAPQAPWTHAFQYPADCLRVRNLIPDGYAGGNQNNPLRVLFAIADATTATKYILTNEQTPLIVYTARIVNPAVWDPLFAEALIVALAKRLAPALASLEVEKVVGADEQAVLPKAEMTVG